jgi:ABC-2 type transport system ATP-binding protein
VLSKYSWRVEIITPVIEVNNLWSSYNGTYALNGVSFAIPSATIMAVVGPNGAGKSTLFKCLVGLIKPLTGSIEIGGVDVIKNPRHAYKKIGYLPERAGVYDALTVEQSLWYAGAIHSIRESDLRVSINTLTLAFKMHDRLQKKIGALSKGLRQTVAIMQAFINNPKIALLDEPASGLDPEARVRLATFLMEKKNQGTTILVSSHILSEIESYSTRLLILKDGQAIEKNHIDIGDVSCQMLRLSISAPFKDVVDFLQAHPKVDELITSSGSIEFGFTGNESDKADLFQKIVPLNKTISGLEIIQSKLKKAYFDSTQE